MFNNKKIALFEHFETPCYFYDTDLLQNTLFAIVQVANLFNYKVHYAIKANANHRILKFINSYKLGTDCVSANEIKRALECGFNSSDIVFAGVGKTYKEIQFAIENNIFCLNVESLDELEVINEIAKSYNKKVRVALRINPNVNAETHSNITTGLSTSKFGISLLDLHYILDHISSYPHLTIDGLHFHIGSQITNLNVFRNLCNTINHIQKIFIAKNIVINHINVGGGLGIDYNNPENQITDFHSYLGVFNKHLNLMKHQTLHIEPGRSIVGQCAILLTRVLYVKNNGSIKTLIVDSGFTELLRPALYQANHKIINLSSDHNHELYDIAGPICETTDYFGKGISLPETKRGDLLAIFSVGAYGETMASQYNLREPALKYYSDDFVNYLPEKIP